MNDNPRDLRCRACGASVHYWDVSRVDPRHAQTIAAKDDEIKRLCEELAEEREAARRMLDAIEKYARSAFEEKRG